MLKPGTLVKFKPGEPANDSMYRALYENKIGEVIAYSPSAYSSPLVEVFFHGVAEGNPIYACYVFRFRVIFIPKD